MSALENILGMLPDRLSSGTHAQIFTPSNIAKEMINVLPEDVWNRHTTFLDPICKSGVFLYEIYQKLMESEDLTEAFPDRQHRREYILNNQLFGIAPDPMCQQFSTRTVYGSLKQNSHIIYLDKYIDTMTNTDKRFLLEALQKEFGMMKFDVVIGNPPYNKGMDLDFVDLGYKLSNKYTVMITPAKWQTTADDYSGCASKNINYKQFREIYVPHMSYVCFYPDCKDIFDIGQRDGITWFIIDKSIHKNCNIINKCKLQKYFNSENIRCITNRESLCNIGAEIVSVLGNYTIFKFRVMNGKYQVWTNNQCPIGGGVGGGALNGGYALASDGTAQYISVSRIVDTSKGEQSPSGASECTFSSDNKSECESFVSWLNCKFTRFFVAINISKLTGILTNDCFRFVPAPPSGKFDHIYTDQELYEAFNLPQKYIDVIEAVIKERK